MLISEERFQHAYGPVYEAALREAKAYVANPAKLKADVELGERQLDRFKLRLPAPEAYPYRLMRYRGFARFPERLKNVVVAEHESRSEVRAAFPTIMDVEPVSRCNFRCVMCQVSDWPRGKRADDISVEQFVAFMDRQPGVTEVKLHGMGEPLLHPRYFEMVRYLAEQDIWVRTNTNGSLLHARENARRLVDSGIGEVQCSFDGATKEAYESIRRNANFERIVENFTLLNAYANRQDRLYTRMWVVLQRDNRHQLLDFVEQAARMGFRRLTFSISLNDWGQEAWHAQNKARQATGLLPEEQWRLAELARGKAMEVTVWRQADKYSTESLDRLCPWPFSRPYISSDLRAVPCCMIGNPEIADLGDATDFEGVWNGPAYRGLRRAHLTGQIPRYCRDCYTLSEDGAGRWESSQDECS